MKKGSPSVPKRMLGRKPRSRKRRLRTLSVLMPWNAWLPNEKTLSASERKRSKSSKKDAGLLRRPQGKSRRKSCVCGRKRKSSSVERKKKRGLKRLPKWPGGNKTRSSREMLRKRNEKSASAKTNWNWREFARLDCAGCRSKKR